LLDRDHIHANILVLDSGVGGLSICQALLALDANLNLRYIADDAEFPYGVKGEAFLIKRLQTLIEVSSLKYHFDMIIVACNTASTLVLPALRAQVDVPVVGVVPAIKPAAAMSSTRTIGLLATPGTIKRAYTQQLIDDFAADCCVLKIGTRVLVEQAERLLMEGELDKSRLANELEHWVFEPDLDVVVLGCTHFPLLRPFLEELLPEVRWVDSAAAIARRVESILSERENAFGKNDGLGAETEHQLMFTASVPDSKAFLAALCALGMGKVRLSKLEL